MSEPFLPRAYQPGAVEFLKKTPRANLWADMGLGKTLIILWLIEQLKLDDVLIIAPYRVVHEVWLTEPKKWWQFEHMNIDPISGTLEKRTAACLMPGRIMATNYDHLLWLCEVYNKTWPFKTVIFDESTRLKGYRSKQGTKRSKALSKVAFDKVERWVNLTGTPNANGLTDLWGQHWFIDGGRTLGDSYEAFLQRWFYKEATERSMYSQLKAFGHSFDEIVSLMRPTTLSIRAKDHFNLRDPIENDVYVSLPTAARKQYDSMQRHFYAELADGTVTAANCGVKSMKLIQFASGAVYHAEDTTVKWSIVHDEKIKALESILEELGGEPLLLIYQFISESIRIKNRFPYAIDVRDKNYSESKWNDGRIRFLLAHPRSAGHGLNLQRGGHHLCFFSPLFDAELYAQVFERIGPVRQIQAGFDRPVYVHNILARNTVDMLAVRRRGRRMGLMDLLLEAMKETEC